MSLHDAAQHLAAQGRGPDDQLIHMSSKEIAGLQALAKSAGGSLTINPETGLAEAGFLDNLLPTLIGAGLAYATGGASLGAELGMAGLSNAAVIGGGLGALETARTGDLGKGLMAGLGAYGGAGLGGAADSSGMFNGVEGAVPAAPNVAPTSFEAGPFNSAAYAPTPTQYGAFGEVPGSVTSVDPSSYGAFGEAPAVNATAPVSDAAQQAASKAMGNVTVAPPAPTVGDLLTQNKGYTAAAAAPAIMGMMQPKGTAPAGRDQMIRPYTFAANAQTPQNQVSSVYRPGQDTSERMWFQPQYTALPPYKAAQGGLMDLAEIATGENVMPSGRKQKMAGGGPVELMSDQAAIGANTGYPMANMTTSAFATPYQDPRSTNMIAPSGGTAVNQMTGEMNPQGTRLAEGGGISTLGSYAAGGNPRLLKGPGDGMSDNIPAMIGTKQPARLADGEFVVPADVVSHLGNGSTEAGAKQLYKMMDRIRQQRTGKKKQAPQVNPGKAMPA